MIWLALVFGGLGTLFSAEVRFPLIVGWLALATAAGLVVLTIERWARVLPAILAYGVFNGLFMIATGHLVDDPSKTISLGTAVTITLLGAGSTVLAITLALRKPTGMDGLAALGVFTSLLAGVMNERLTVWSFGLMFCCMAIAWWTHRGRTRHRTRVIGTAFRAHPRYSKTAKHDATVLAGRDSNMGSPGALIPLTSGIFQLTVGSRLKAREEHLRAITRTILSEIAVAVQREGYSIHATRKGKNQSAVSECLLKDGCGIDLYIGPETSSQQSTMFKVAGFGYVVRKHDYVKGEAQVLDGWKKIMSICERVVSRRDTMA